MTLDKDRVNRWWKTKHLSIFPATWVTQNQIHFDGASFWGGVAHANRKGIRWSCPLKTAKRQSSVSTSWDEDDLRFGSGFHGVATRKQGVDGDDAFWVGKSLPLNSEIMLLEWIVVYIFLTWIQITILGWYVYFFPTIFHATIRNDVSNCQQIGDILQCLFASKNLFKFGSCI